MKSIILAIVWTKADIHKEVKMGEMGERMLKGMRRAYDKTGKTFVVTGDGASAQYKGVWFGEKLHFAGVVELSTGDILNAKTTGVQYLVRDATPQEVDGTV